MAANGADFSGMSASKDPMGQLYIGKVIHKAFVEVNEEGAEAAAATALVVRAESAGPGEFFPPKVFRADHPFIYMIRDDHSGSILFMGRVGRPESAAVQ